MPPRVIPSNVLAQEKMCLIRMIPERSSRDQSDKSDWNGPLYIYVENGRVTKIMHFFKEQIIFHTHTRRLYSLKNCF